MSLDIIRVHRTRLAAARRPGTGSSSAGVCSSALPSDANACRADPFRSLDPGASLGLPTGINRLVAKQILVAGKGTREARRALSGSLPFLHYAEKVFLVEVCAEQRTTAARRQGSRGLCTGIT